MENPSLEIPSRRRLMQLGLYAAGSTVAAGAGAYVFATAFERHWLETTLTRIALDLGEGGPRKLRVTLLSDFHYDPLCEAGFVAETVARAQATQPDLILLLGDYVSERADVIGEVADILGGLSAPLGVKAILGNHDFWRGQRQVESALTRQGIEVLRNSLVRIPASDGELVLAGFDSIWGGRPDVGSLRVKEGERILLAHHEPDYILRIPDPLRDRVALQVSGHTHGGQICAPGGLVLFRVSHGKHFTRGLYEVSPKTRIFVTRGIGTISIHARFFCRPEISVLELTNTSRILV